MMDDVNPIVGVLIAVIALPLIAWVMIAGANYDWHHPQPPCVKSHTETAFHPMIVGKMVSGYFAEQVVCDKYGPATTR